MLHGFPELATATTLLLLPSDFKVGEPTFSVYHLLTVGIRKDSFRSL